MWIFIRQKVYRRASKGEFDLIRNPFLWRKVSVISDLHWLFKSKENENSTNHTRSFTNLHRIESFSTVYIDLIKHINKEVFRCIFLCQAKGKSLSEMNIPCEARTPANKQCLSNIMYNSKEHNPKLCLMGFDYQKITLCSNHSNGRCYTDVT